MTRLRLFASGDAAKWRQLTEQLRTRIRSGEYPPGAQIPTESQLESVTGLSRTTVRRAVAELRAGGLVATRPPHGTFVVDRGGLVALGDGDTAVSAAPIVITRADGSTELCPPGAMLSPHRPTATR